MAASVIVSVSAGALRGQPVWTTTCEVCGLVGTRAERERAEALADEHWARHRDA